MIYCWIVPVLIRVRKLINIQLVDTLVVIIDILLPTGLLGECSTGVRRGGGYFMFANVETNGY